MKKINGEDYKEYLEPLASSHDSDKEKKDDYLIDDYAGVLENTNDGSLCFSYPSIGPDDYIPNDNTNMCTSHTSQRVSLAKVKPQEKRNQKKYIA